MLGLLEVSDLLFTESAVRPAIQSRTLFQLPDKSESLKLDTYLRELVPGELQRSQTLKLLDGVFLPVVSRADAAISKLIWVEKGRQLSRRDFRGIFRNCEYQQQLEFRGQAARLNLSHLLDEVLSETDGVC